MFHSKPYMLPWQLILVTMSTYSVDSIKETRFSGTIFTMPKILLEFIYKVVRKIILTYLRIKCDLRVKIIFFFSYPIFPYWAYHLYTTIFFNFLYHMITVIQVIWWSHDYTFSPAIILFLSLSCLNLSLSASSISI